MKLLFSKKYSRCLQAVGNVHSIQSDERKDIAEGLKSGTR